MRRPPARSALRPGRFTSPATNTEREWYSRTRTRAGAGHALLGEQGGEAARPRRPRSGRPPSPRPGGGRRSPPWSGRWGGATGRAVLRPRPRARLPARPGTRARGPRPGPEAKGTAAGAASDTSARQGEEARAPGERSSARTEETPAHLDQEPIGGGVEGVEVRGAALAAIEGAGPPLPAEAPPQPGIEGRRCRPPGAPRARGRGRGSRSSAYPSPASTVKDAGQGRRHRGRERRVHVEPVRLEARHGSGAVERSATGSTPARTRGSASPTW